MVARQAMLRRWAPCLAPNASSHEPALGTFLQVGAHSPAGQELDAARADEEELDRGRENAARLLALGELTQDDYRAAKSAADARRREVAERVADLHARLARCRRTPRSTTAPSAARRM